MSSQTNCANNSPRLLSVLEEASTNEYAVAQGNRGTSPWRGGYRALEENLARSEMIRRSEPIQPYANRLGLFTGSYRRSYDVRSGAAQREDIVSAEALFVGLEITDATSDHTCLPSEISSSFRRNEFRGSGGSMLKAALARIAAHEEEARKEMCRMISIAKERSECSGEEEGGASTDAEKWQSSAKVDLPSVSADNIKSLSGKHEGDHVTSQVDETTSTKENESLPSMEWWTGDYSTAADELYPTSNDNHQGRTSSLVETGLIPACPLPQNPTPSSRTLSKRKSCNESAELEQVSFLGANVARSGRASASSKSPAKDELKSYHVELQLE